MKQLATVWTAHVKEADKKKSFEDAVRNSTVALGRLKEILLEEDKALSNSSLKSPTGDPSWAFTQAHISGERNRIKKILDLISFI
jgi:hypothetical protein